MKAKTIRRPAPAPADSDFAEIKALCRHYYALNPAATASYVHAYRDMWDSDAKSRQDEV
jgi:hypothetical protein